MADNAQKTHLGLTLNQFSQQKILSEIQKLGKAIPCSVTAVSNSIVTVSFDITGPFTLPSVTIPLFGPEWIRYPIQVGTLGVVFPAGFYLGGVSGLGGGVADMAQPGNLSALVFFPVGNKNWANTDDANAVVVYGPNGVKLRDQGATTHFTLIPGEISMSAGGHSIVINSTGVVIDGKIFLTHEHTGVTTGSGDTGGVI